MKILVIGTGHSQFVKEPLEFAFNKSNDNVYVTYDEGRNDLFKDFYKENDIKLINTHQKTNIISRIPKIGVLYNLFKATRTAAKEKNFDVIHVHSVSNYILTWFIVNVLSMYTKKIAITFYGSDLMLREDKELKRFDKLFEKVDCFSMATDNLIERFRKAFGNKYDSKIMKVPFGLASLISIDEAKPKDECKHILGVDKNKVLISIGHNTCVEQQHLQVLDAMSSLSQNIIKEITILLQLTYGNGSLEHVNAIEEKAKSLGCDVVILKEYMNRNEVATMAKAVDIYINSQISDAISGAMLEYMYAETVVLNPKWIDYNELKKNGCQYYEYENFDELPNILRDLINDKGTLDISNNHEIIHSLSHWESHKGKWRKFLEG